MTKQEIFDKAVTGIASQGFRRSMGDDGVCAYRGADGARCAVGWLLPDDKYSAEFEGTAISTYNAFDSYSDKKRGTAKAIMSAIGANPEDRDMVSFVAELQRAHDSAYRIEADYSEKNDPAKMRRQLRKLADDYRLTIPEVLNG